MTDPWTEADADAHREKVFDLMEGKSDQYVVVNRRGTSVAYGPFASEADADDFIVRASRLPVYDEDYWLRLPLAAPSENL